MRKKRDETYHGTVPIEQWSTEKPPCKKEENLERSDPGNIRRTLMLQLIVLVVRLKDANKVVSDRNVFHRI